MLTFVPGIGFKYSYNPRDLGYRKVQRRAERDFVDLSAHRGEVSKAEYPRCPLGGTPSFCSLPWFKLNTEYRFD